MGYPGRVDALSLEANMWPVDEDEIYDHFVYNDKSRIPYLHIESLGHGTFGYVDKVRRNDGRFLGRVYARKTIRIPLDIVTSTRVIPDTLNNEVRIIRMARHAHVISVTATYMCGRDFAIIMTPVAEENLEEYLHRVDLTPLDNRGMELRGRISPWFGCLIGGLAYLHAQGIRHRDIKPSNILITADNILLTDFGISMERPGDTTLTLTDTLGTKLYCAPEVADSIRSGRPADIFSLGAVFLEMLSLCLGQGELADFRKYRQSTGGRSYAANLDKVSQWILRLTSTSHHEFWGYSTILVLSQQMLQAGRGARPTAETLRLCWSYRPYLELPGTSCDCILVLLPSALFRDGGSSDQSRNHTDTEFKDLLSNIMAGIEDPSMGNESGVALPYQSLHAVARIGSLDRMHNLLDSGADIEQEDAYGRKALHWAALFGHENMIKLLLGRRALVDAKDGHGWTALCFATRLGHEAAVRMLLELGADPNAVDESGHTALHVVHSEAVGRLLLRMGAYLDAQDIQGWTPLQYAVFSKYKSVVGLLLESGADVYVQSTDGSTVLATARQTGDAAISEMLNAHCSQKS